MCVPIINQTSLFFRMEQQIQAALPMRGNHWSWTFDLLQIKVLNSYSFLSYGALAGPALTIDQAGLKLKEVHLPCP